MNLNLILLQAAPASGGMGYSTIIMMVLIFAVMYFLMIRPQQKRQKALNQFRSTLEKGTKVITAGGIFGVIKEVKDNLVVVEVDNNVNLRMDKSMIMRDPSDVAAGQQK